MELCRNSSKSWQIRGEGGHVDIDVEGRDIDVSDDVGWLSLLRVFDTGDGRHL